MSELLDKVISLVDSVSQLPIMVYHGIEVVNIELEVLELLLPPSRLGQLFFQLEDFNLLRPVCRGRFL